MAAKNPDEVKVDPADLAFHLKIYFANLSWMAQVDPAEHPQDYYGYSRQAEHARASIPIEVAEHLPSGGVLADLLAACYGINEEATSTDPPPEEGEENES